MYHAFLHCHKLYFLMPVQHLKSLVKRFADFFADVKYKKGEFGTVTGVMGIYWGIILNCFHGVSPYRKIYYDFHWQYSHCLVIFIYILPFIMVYFNKIS